MPGLPQSVLLETFIDSDNSILICPKSYFALIKQLNTNEYKDFVPVFIFISASPNALEPFRQHRKTREDTPTSNDDQ